MPLVCTGSGYALVITTFMVFCFLIQGEDRKQTQKQIYHLAIITSTMKKLNNVLCWKPNRLIVTGGLSEVT
jgi:hypothetical protein